MPRPVVDVIPYTRCVTEDAVLVGVAAEPHRNIRDRDGVVIDFYPLLVAAELAADAAEEADAIGPGDQAWELGIALAPGVGADALIGDVCWVVVDASSRAEKGFVMDT